MRVVVDHLAGSRNGQRQTVDLPAGGRLRFGRHPDNEIAFDAHRDLDASTWHAEMRREGSEVFLVDLGSSNGTEVNGQRVDRLPVKPGMFQVAFGGGPVCRITLGEAAPAQVPQTLAVGGGKVFGAQTVAGLVRRSTRRFTVLLLSVTSVFVAALAFVVLRDSRRSEANEQRLATVQSELNEKLRDQQIRARNETWDAEPGLKITAENALAVYLIGYTDASGEDRALCTAFAVLPQYLATNAHCVDALERLDADKRPVFAVRNKTPRRFTLTGWTRDQRYRGEGYLSPDVGLVKVDGTMDKLVTLATADRAQKLGEGSKIFLYGFPAAVADPQAPVASLLDGIVGRVTTFKGESNGADDLLVQHNAMTSPGASGSPIFDASGHVVAVNVGQYRERGEEHIVAPGVNVSIRIDGLFPLLEAKRNP